MQGWRVSQEDAHTCILDFDTDTSLFAVFDGHGGAEVAIYSAKNLPQVLKQLPAYKEDRIAEALEEAFLKFDSSLTSAEVIKELKALAGNLEDDDEDEDDENEAALLHEEANIPIEDIIARYGNSEQKERKANTIPAHMKAEMTAKEKPLSPYLRAKQNNDLKKTECSSSTAKAVENVCEPSCSSSCVSNGEHRKSKKIDECESVSSSVEAKNKGGFEIDNNNVSSSKIDDKVEEFHPSDDKNEQNLDSVPSSSSPTGNNVKVTDVNKKDAEDEEGGVSTSSEVKGSCDGTIDDETKDDCSRPTSSDKCSEESPSCSKGKGKQKKVVQQPNAVTEDVSLNSQPIYEAFLKDFEIETDSSESEHSDDDTEDYKANIADSDSDDDVDVEDEENSSDDEEVEDEIEFKGKNKLPLEKRLFMSSAYEYEEPGKDSGCTAVLSLLRGNKLYVANAGDSRCVICRNGKAIDMSIDHKPEDEYERRRIEKAGGEVTSDGRVNGGLNLSRAIGDHSYKENPNVSLKDQMISASPDVKDITLVPGEDKFMVLACDGIWNSMTSQQVVDFISQRIDNTDKLSKICEELFLHCLSPDTMGDGTGCDNMTCVIVRLDCIGKKKREREESETEVQQSDDAKQTKKQKTESQISSETI
ncbi:putative protein phosphatase 2C 11-like isoform X1 [Leptotrombidium deliense]|uniref:protein-serine/threonine phosphatase n=1 Tax=Leptotrombidium deliense TaxID=299467 RepID=A0A443SP85_9ACAR|nr:putative protein phosphatase 2C 11-like isoform X1 [Leptotrombidium deliense]